LNAGLYWKICAWTGGHWTCQNSKLCLSLSHLYVDFAWLSEARFWA
jgi:hypothetical protein